MFFSLFASPQGYKFTSEPNPNVEGSVKGCRIGRNDEEYIRIKNILIKAYQDRNSETNIRSKSDGNL